MATMNAEGLAQMWEHKVFSDAVICFTLHPKAAKSAVKAHMEQAEQQQGLVSTPPQRTTRGQAQKLAQQASDAAPMLSKLPMVSPPKWPEGAMVLETHTGQLLATSKVIQKQLLGQAMKADSQLRVYNENGTAFKHLVMVGLDSESMLSASEQFMRLTYCQDLPADIKTQPDTLLQIYLLADQLESHIVMAACVTALAALPVDQLQPSHISYVLQLLEDTELAADSSDLQALRANCEKQLVLVFGDACKVVNDRTMDGLRKQFCSLSFAAMLHWVQSPHTRTDSENTILALINLWYLSGRRTDAEMTVLASHVRVPLLSPLFTPGEMYPVDWFQPRDKLHKVLIINNHYSPSLAVSHRPSLPNSLRKRLLEDGCPPAWLNNQPRPPAPSAVTELTVEVNEEELREGIEMAQTGKKSSWAGSTHVIMGFECTATFTMAQSGEVGMFVHAIQRAGTSLKEPRAGCPTSKSLDTLCITAMLSIPAHAPGLQVSATLETFIAVGESRGFNNMLRNITSLSDLAPWIMDDKLMGKVSVSRIDGIYAGLETARAARR